MSCCSCFAACSDNDLYSDSSRKTCWQFTNHSLTSQNVVNLLHPHSKTDKIFCQSVFVKGETEAHDGAGAYLDVTHLPDSLASVCHDGT